MTNLVQRFFMADIIKSWKFLLMLQKKPTAVPLFASIGAIYILCKTECGETQGTGQCMFL